MIRRIFAGLGIFLCSAFFSFADEGMWLINGINAALEKKMRERGLELGAREIYNADAEGSSIADAVVSIGFYCTGSLISKEGLLITNHHCAYGDIHALSTNEHNYLEEGYWAMRRDKELPVKGKEVFFLKKVIDVTKEVEELKENLKNKGELYGQRRISYLIEKRYKDKTGLEAYLSSMWGGEKYYIALYKVYTDLRLVAAPPISISAFGGAEDNWEWPQHKGDFAIYRIYANIDGSPSPYSKSNVPLQTSCSLKISTKPYKPGDFTMVIGYPGKTKRHSSWAEIGYMRRSGLPWTVKIMKEKAEILQEWMEKDDEIRLKYSNDFFNLTNLQEMLEGQKGCLKRFKVLEEKNIKDRELQAWIEEDAERKSQWGSLIEDLKKLYSETEFVEKNKAIYRETILRGTSLCPLFFKMHNCKNGTEEELFQEGLKGIDTRVEYSLLQHSVQEYFSNIDSSFLGPKQKELRNKFGADYSAMTAYLWKGSIMEGLKKEVDLENDKLWEFFSDVNISVFNSRDNNLEKKKLLSSLRSEYIKALYSMRLDKGLAQYPDANSTMRISYGKICTLEPKDGISLSWHSTTKGILEKNKPDCHDFQIDERFKHLIEERKFGKMASRSDKKSEPELYVNFLTDNDISGGNSGSPVLNSKGELIGLAFDGNKESLASEFSYTKSYNKCICVDIRYVLWILDQYAGMTEVLKELGFQEGRLSP